MAKNDIPADEIGFEEKHQYTGLGLSLISIAVYLAIVLTRVFTDDVSVTKVAWQGPMLLVIAVGGGLYGIGYGIARTRQKGQAKDARDAEIDRYGDATGGGLLSLTVFVTIILLALGVDTFWVAHNLFLGSWFASFIGSASKAAAYREGIPS